MLISEKRTGSIYSKELSPIARQFRKKNNGQKALVKVVKCAENKCWVPRKPSGHLSVNIKARVQ